MASAQQLPELLLTINKLRLVLKCKNTLIFSFAFIERKGVKKLIHKPHLKPLPQCWLCLSLPPHKHYLPSPQRAPPVSLVFRVEANKLPNPGKSVLINLKIPAGFQHLLTERTQPGSHGAFFFCCFFWVFFCTLQALAPGIREGCKLSFAWVVYSEGGKKRGKNNIL